MYQSIFSIQTNNAKNYDGKWCSAPRIAYTQYTVHFHLYTNLDFSVLEVFGLELDLGSNWDFVEVFQVAIQELQPHHGVVVTWGGKGRKGGKKLLFQIFILCKQLRISKSCYMRVVILFQLFRVQTVTTHELSVCLFDYTEFFFIRYM